MSKFASSFVLILSLAMLAAGALIPRIAILSFLAGIANYVFLAGLVLLCIAMCGLKAFLYFLLFSVIFYIVHFAVSFVFGLLGLGGLVFDLIGLVLAAFGAYFVVNKIP